MSFPKWGEGARMGIVRIITASDGHRAILQFQYLIVGAGKYLRGAVLRRLSARRLFFETH